MAFHLKKRRNRVIFVIMVFDFHRSPNVSELVVFGSSYANLRMSLALNHLKFPLKLTSPMRNPYDDDHGKCWSSRDRSLCTVRPALGLENRTFLVSCV